MRCTDKRRRPELDNFCCADRCQRSPLAIVTNGRDTVLISFKDAERLVDELIIAHQLIGRKRPNEQIEISSKNQFVVLA